jgi:hypothetical protein
MIPDRASEEQALPLEPPSAQMFLAPDAVPRRKNQMMAAALAVIAIVILAIVLTLTLLIRYDNMPSLLSYFT